MPAADNAVVILDTTDPDSADHDAADPYGMSELIAPTYRTADDAATRQARLERQDVAAGNAYRFARLNGASKAEASRAAGVARRAAT